MANKSRQMSIDEASEYWDHHSVAEHQTRLVEIVYAPEERSTLVAIENDLLARITQSAKERGVSVETLVNLWLQEKLTA